MLCMLLTYYNYTGEETNTLVNHLTREFERMQKYGTFDLRRIYKLDVLF
jgi:hypothetical protein